MTIDNDIENWWNSTNWGLLVASAAIVILDFLLFKHYASILIRVLRKFEVNARRRRIVERNLGTQINWVCFIAMLYVAVAFSRIGAIRVVPVWMDFCLAVPLVWLVKDAGSHGPAIFLPPRYAGQPEPDSGDFVETVIATEVCGIIAGIAIAIILYVLVLTHLGVPPLIVLMIVGLLAGVTVASRGYIQNIIGGMVAFASGAVALKAGISIGKVEGIVVDFNPRCTCIRLQESTLAYIPNGMFLTHPYQTGNVNPTTKHSLDIAVSKEMTTPALREFIRTADAALEKFQRRGTAAAVSKAGNDKSDAGRRYLIHLTAPTTLRVSMLLPLTLNHVEAAKIRSDIILLLTDMLQTFRVKLNSS